MNADTFDRSSNTCPVCHHTGKFPSVESVGGLLTCPQCRSRLVVSLSGHYVRDPFAVRKSARKLSAQQLRKQSRPIARILRDSGIAKHSSLIVILSSLLVGGFSMSVLSQADGQKLTDWVQQVRLKNIEPKD
ncbi:MAG TPA: hypothetical protein VL134_13450 [Leptolyngbya sp.]|jgi:hypothetical protein|nr:hypothetical protein [Leptolyngbya sp.]